MLFMLFVTFSKRRVPQSQRRTGKC